MRRTSTMVITWLAMAPFLLLGHCIGSSAQQPQPRPVPGDGPNCLPFHTLKSDAVVTRLMLDTEGDWWLHVRFASTGKLQMGYLSRETGKFCVLGEGQTNRES